MPSPQIATIVRPPSDIFEKNSAEFQKHQDSAVANYQFERVEYPEEGGMLVHYYDQPFPTKGNPYPEAVTAIGVPKKLFKTKAYFIKAHPILGAFILMTPMFFLRRFPATTCRRSSWS